MPPRPETYRRPYPRANPPDSQERIREEIRSGPVRVVPDGDGIAIIPRADMPSGPRNRRPVDIQKGSSGIPGW
jgi:hypothetical protein